MGVGGGVLGFRVQTIYNSMTICPDRERETENERERANARETERVRKSEGDMVREIDG